MEDLGHVPGSSATFAEGLNNNGDVVGVCVYPDRNVLHTAFLWQQGVLFNLTANTDRRIERATRINDSGQIIAGSALFQTRDDFRFIEHPETRNAIKFVGTVRINWTVTLRAINNKGQIIGWAHIPVETPVDAGLPRHIRRSFLWEDGMFIDIVAEDGDFFQAYDINDNGVIVGSAHDGDRWAAYSLANGTRTDLGSLGDHTVPTAINENAEVVGEASVGSRNDEGDAAYHGFLWKNGEMIDLDQGTNHQTRPLDINNHTQIVGEHFDNSTESGPNFGFLWHDGRMYDLNEAVDDRGPWYIVRAVAINDDGQIACVAKRTVISHRQFGRDNPHIYTSLLLNPRRERP